MISDAAQLKVFLNIMLAMALGAAVGLDREYADKSAGLRTHMLVAGASALLVSLGNSMVSFFDTEHSEKILRADPVRVIQAIVIGVSFIAGGTIIRGGGQARGLTTAASLLFASAIGIAAALHEFLLSVSVTVLVVLVLTVIGKLESRMNTKPDAET